MSFTMGGRITDTAIFGYFWMWVGAYYMSLSAYLKKFGLGEY